MMQNLNLGAFQSRNRNLNIQGIVGSGKAGPTSWYFMQIFNVHFFRFRGL